MNLTTEVGDRRQLVLSKAILLYEEQVFGREQFATVHSVVRGGTDSPQLLGPGSLLNLEFLRRLAKGLRQDADSIVLPGNVLVYSSDLLIWWTPPRLHSMFFSEGAEDRAAIDGRICPHPSLVWKVDHGSLYLRALV